MQQATTQKNRNIITKKLCEDMPANIFFVV